MFMQDDTTCRKLTCVQPDIKKLQIQLTGFLEKDTPAFCQELWKLCLSAQSNPQGVPKELLEAKKLELIQEKVCHVAIYFTLMQFNVDISHSSKQKRPPKTPGAGVRMINAEIVKWTQSENANVTSVVEVLDLAVETAGEVIEATEVLVEVAETLIDVALAGLVLRLTVTTHGRGEGSVVRLPPGT